MARTSDTPKTEQPEELNVVILNREFTLMVAPNDRAPLEKAVAMVDQKMRTIRDNGKIGGVDKIAIMAALQIADELVKAGSAANKRVAAAAATAAASKDAAAPGNADALDAETMRKVHKLNDKLEAELKKQEDLF